MKVVLGVAGGIAAYKAASLLRLFTEAGHDLTVVPTASALHFVGEATWSALSGKPVHTDVWSDITDVPHVRIGQQADLVIVAPATADLLARAASGQADDLLTNVLLTARCPIVMAPAMHTEMWEHPATQANVATLSERGVHIVPPASGRLTGKDTGPGRLPEPEELYAVCARLLEHPRAVAATAPVTEVIATRGPLRGRHVVVSAGGTREPLDPVRFLGNRSSGKQGYAVAAAAAARGARVTLVTTADLQLPTGVESVRVETAQQLRAAMLEHFDSADVIVMAAAVADFRPADYVDTKIKKGMAPGDDSAPEIRLVRNPDILAELVRHRGDAAGPVIVGFAAETGDAKASVLEHGRAKLERKGCDVLVVNEVGSDKTFGKDENTVHLLLQGSSRVEDVGPADKRVIADAIWDLVETLV
ncbi:MAG TPA: bifunctional phosphopantothenoylcysteine decarboxylase/phosphopantothenate--cysteine ligase CoaBC [Phycicoccus elongatus]|uniref:bifunctional phosphopantothenoylcysteine decarboxylase/phosphopantothenate--cysteine ligase CoaBC n=1 Tax=Phycicoccus elongatus TaxID=101689 RepID=UPI002B522464|nr:bifunctional phosphopantothenoylcysteine decarboxylase/phosphopantothenate--cysteine ligase CoaBC [Phycicoccus elongatus]HPK12573.1 bifunctional phosphopantothenoylcysteine decarboxylase/phosphopantothenate--cysteine ligase CoaBC [Phycicoccus elongatus]